MADTRLTMKLEDAQKRLLECVKPNRTWDRVLNCVDPDTLGTTLTTLDKPIPHTDYTPVWEAAKGSMNENLRGNFTALTGLQADDADPTKTVDNGMGLLKDMETGTPPVLPPTAFQDFYKGQPDADTKKVPLGCANANGLYGVAQWFAHPTFSTVETQKRAEAAAREEQANTISRFQDACDKNAVVPDAEGKPTKRQCINLDDKDNPLAKATAAADAAKAASLCHPFWVKRFEMQCRTVAWGGAALASVASIVAGVWLGSRRAGRTTAPVPTDAPLEVAVSVRKGRATIETDFRLGKTREESLALVSKWRNNDAKVRWYNPFNWFRKKVDSATAAKLKTEIDARQPAPVVAEISVAPGVPAIRIQDRAHGETLYTQWEAAGIPQAKLDELRALIDAMPATP